MRARVNALSARLEELGLAIVIETGARYLLDPRRKHEPTLVSDHGRERRLDLYRRAIAIAAELRRRGGLDLVGLHPGRDEPR